MKHAGHLWSLRVDERLSVSLSAGVAGLFCSRSWDGWLCWDDAPAGTYASQNCPDYFRDFDPSGEQ